MWLKKNGNSLFENIMTTFDKAKFCKTGMFLLNKNSIMTQKKNVG